MTYKKKILLIVFIGLFAFKSAISYADSEGSNDIPVPESPTTHIKIKGESKVIPLPAFSTSPTEGESYGILPVWLFLNDEKKIKRIIAPSLTYNNIFGVTGTFRLFEYIKEGKRYEFILGRSTEHDQTISLKYFDSAILSSRFKLDTGFKHINDISYRFFGIGGDSKKDDETNYTHNELRWHIKASYPISDNAQISLIERFRRVQVSPGAVHVLPYIRDRFPDVPGINRARTLTHTIDLSYDTRDLSEQPTEGTYANLYAEIAQKIINTDSAFIKYGAHIKRFFPMKENRFILVLRGLFDKEDGHDIPFYERSMLGGEDTLRGFGLNRFFDNNRVLFSSELRIIVFKLSILNVSTEWEVSPFLEAGRVFKSYDLPMFRGFKCVTGVGVRAIVRPNVVGRFDVGIASEGVAVFVGLGYPF